MCSWPVVQTGGELRAFDMIKEAYRYEDNFGTGVYDFLEPHLTFFLGCSRTRTSEANTTDTALLPMSSKSLASAFRYEILLHAYLCA